MDIIKMGHNSIDKPFIGREPSRMNGSEVIPDASWCWSKRYIGQLDSTKLLNSIVDGIEGMELSSNRKKSDIWLNNKGIKLLFNIGPSFIHLLSINKNTGNSFNYLFDSNNGLTCIQDNPRNLEIPLENSHTVRTLSSHLLNGLNNSLIKLNIYKNNCICEKCLIGTHFLCGTEAAVLRKEVLNIFKSSYCNDWNLNWIKVLIEQILVFFSCIKHGIIFERLIESASLCGKLLLLKNQCKDLLEFKYGYIYFHINFVYTIALVKNKSSTNNNRSTNRNFEIKEVYKKVTVERKHCIHFYGTGKEEREIIDGVKIVSFETETDMNEYTRLENLYLRKIRTPSPINGLEDDNEIVPTKTTDITKIKGWRNKLFSPFGSTKQQKKDLQKKMNEDFTEDKENYKKNDISFVNMSEKCRIQPRHEDKYINKIEKFTTKKFIAVQKVIRDSCKENNKLTQKNEPKLIVKNEVNSGNPIKLIVNNSSNKISEAPRKLPHKTTVKVETNPDETKIEVNVNKVKNSVFESDVLDDFLKNNSRLNISYEIPTLHAAKALNTKPITQNLFKRNNNLIKQLNNKQSLLIPKDKIKTEPIDDSLNTACVEIKQEPIEIKDEPEINTNNIKPTRTSITPHKNVQQTRYIWVQGRPIEIVNGIKEEDMVAQNKHFPIKSIPLKVIKKSKESQTDFPLLEDYTEVKVKVEPEEAISEVDVKRPRLLTNITSEDLDCLPKQLKAPNSFGPNLIPFIHNCEFINECNCKNFSLGMILNIGKRRPLSKEAIHNLEELHVNDSEITERMATIAASAVNTDKNKRIITRLVVPVVSKNIFSTIDNWEQRLSYDRIAESIPNTSSNQIEIDPEVNAVVDDLVNFTVTKLNHVDIPYDPMYTPSSKTPKKTRKEKFKTKSKVVRELRKLINVSIIDECKDSLQVKTESVCGNDFCVKGCICNSLNNKIKYQLHCGKINCQFECNCQDKEIYRQIAIKADQQSDVVLAKEELTWHQTVIRSEDGDRIEVMNSVDKSKREKKLPTRFRNNVLLGKEMYPSATPASLQPKVPAFLPEQQKVLEERKVILKGESLKKQIMRRRLGYCAGIISGQRSLADVFIWCGIHDKYNCLCVSWICRLKHNAFIWKPEKMTRYLPHKLMTGMELSTKFNYEVFLYDPKRFCARTYGAPIEYAVRNRSSTFLAKRNCEFQNGVISCTNSYIKMKFFMVKDKTGSKKLKKFLEGDFPEVFKAPPEERVNIISAIDEEDIEIFDDLPPIIPDYVDIETESEEEEDHEDDESSDEQNSLCRNDLLLDTDNDKEKLAISKVYLSTKSSKSLPRRESFLKLSNQNKLQDPIEQSVPSLTLTTVKPDTISFKKIELNSEKRKRSSCDIEPLTILVGDKSANNLESNTDKTPCIKKKRLLISPSDNLKTPHLPFKDKIDYELENDLIKLENHPLKEQMYGEDSLPKLALLCLTPGIGFLPILEFNSDLLAVQDPVFPEFYHSFKNLDSANQWLNKFFKNRLIFETIDTSLKWVIVKPGIIKLKQSPPFSPALLENPSIVVTKDGGLIFKKKDYSTGGICRGAIKVAPLSLSGSHHQVISIKEHSEHKRKICSISSTEQIVDICDGDGKRRKIQIETIPVQKPCEQILKRPVNIFRQIPSVKIQESLTGIPVAGGNSGTTIVQAGDGTMFPVNSVNTSPVLRVSIDTMEKKPSLVQINGSTIPIVKSNVRPLIVSSSAAGPLRVQVTPAGVTSLCPRNILPTRSQSPPPLAIRSDVVTNAAVYSTRSSALPLVSEALPLAGTKDTRPILIHNNTLIPINIKTAPNSKIYK